MAGVMAINGKIELLNYAVMFTFGDCSVGLFRNDYVPTVNTTMANLTVANFSGYEGLELLSFGPAFDRGDDNAQANRDGMLVWEHNGGGVSNTIYGWFIAGPNNSVAWAERLPLPVSMGAEGDRIRISLAAIFGQLPLA